MALNLTELQQKADRVIHNADEFVRRWTEFLSAPAGTVTMEYYDPNGNLQTVTFDNRNKLVQDFIANANSVMSKTVYVDQVNGNDANDGSQAAPFKTIQKAIDSAPTGGSVVVRIVGDYVVESNITALKKRVLLVPEGTMTFGWRVYGTNYSALAGFTLHDSLVAVIITSPNNGKLIIEPNTTGLPAAPVYASAFRTDQSSNFGHLYFYLRVGVDNYNPIVVNSGALFGISQWSRNRPTFLGVNLSGEYAGTNRSIIVDTANGARLGTFLNCPGSLFYNYPHSIVDTAGTALTLANVVGGIVRDANGVPRNVISNIVL